MSDRSAHLVSANAERLHDLDVQVVYTDLDGTMLGRGGVFTHDPGGEPTLEPVRALLAAQQAGIDVVPTSGRTLRGLVGDGRILGMGTVIAEMGALIAYDWGREVVTNLGSYPGDHVLPARFMEECGAVSLIFDRFRGKIEHHTPWSSLRDYTQLFRGSVDCAEVNASLAEGGFGWLEIVDNGTLHASYLGFAEGECHAYHLLPRGVSKGTAIAVDQRRRTFTPEQCVAIGDAVADLELAAETAFLILVRDAVERDPVLAERAAAMENVLVTDRPGNLGWADALELLARR